MKTLYIMCGLGFSGKSTLAKAMGQHLNVPVVSQDEIFFKKKAELSSIKEDQEFWRVLLDMGEDELRQLLRQGQSVIFDSVNLSRNIRDELRALAKEAGAEAVVVYLDTPEYLLDERQAKNKVTKERHDVDQKDLDKAKKDLEPPTEDENVHVFRPDSDLQIFLGQLPR